MPVHRLILGAFLALSAASVAFRARSLTMNGAISAFVLGTLVFGAGGWKAAAALITFFVTSSALSRWRKTRKEKLGFAKSGARDAFQVWENGGVAAACLLAPLLRQAGTVSHWHILFLGAIAAANADTWATEIGSISGGRPWDLRTGRRVEPGTSGAISVCGTIAAGCGAALIGLFAIETGFRAFAAVVFGGFGGALVDSVVGATLQAQWSDPTVPGAYSEKRRSSSKPSRGLSFIENGAVNLICTAAGVLITEMVLYDPFWR